MGLKEKILQHFNGDFLPGYKRYISAEFKKEKNGNQLKTLCPLHGDSESSLSIERKTGKFNCFGCKTNGDFFTFYALLQGLNVKTDFPKILKKIALDFGIENNLPSKNRKIIATYDYNDQNGKLLFQKVKYNPKGFAQRRPDGNGGWINNVKGVEIIPYNLQRVIESQEICIPEGEKDCDNLNKLGFHATTNPGGAGNWTHGLNKFFKGKDIVIFSDNDEPGRDHAKKVAKSLNDTAADIKVIELPGLKEHQDVSDFIDSFTDTDQANEELCRIIENAKPYQAQTSIDEIKIRKKAQEILDARQPCGTYDLSQLPSPLRELCEDICEETEAEPIMILQSALVTASALVKKKIYIPEGEYFQKLFANLWVLSIAPSGDFKSTSVLKACRVAWEKAQEVKEAKDLLGDKPDKEELYRVLCNSPLLPISGSAEAFFEELSNGRAGMIVTVEFGEWLEGFEKQYNQGFKSAMAKYYDVIIPPDERTTKSSGHIFVEEPYICINGVSTIDWIKDNVNPVDVRGGFFARFLFLYPPQKNTIPPALPPKNTKPRNFNPVDEYREIIFNVPDKTEFKLSLNAEALFTKIHNELYQSVRKENDDTQKILNPYLKRWSPYVLKLAMLMQLFIEPHSNIITVPAIKAGKSIVDYAIKSTTFLFKTYLGENPHQATLRKVIEFIAKKGGKVTRKILQTRGPQEIRADSKELDSICDSAEDAGQLEINRNPKLKRDWTYKLTED
jgi:5S rRNA maturation endonuclease (ribonuclease M5)